MKNKRSYITFGIIIILSLPYIFKAPWTLSDYMVAAVLLFGTAYLIEYVTGKVKTSRKKLLAGLTVIILAVFLWVELAVGIIGSPLAGS